MTIKVNVYPVPSDKSAAAHLESNAYGGTEVGDLFGPDMYGDYAVVDRPGDDFDYLIGPGVEEMLKKFLAIQAERDELLIKCQDLLLEVEAWEQANSLLRARATGVEPDLVIRLMEAVANGCTESA